MRRPVANAGQFPPLGPVEAAERAAMRCPVERRRYVLTERELLDPGLGRRKPEPQA